jgi:transcriptional regulator with XRE-family HTH domain
MGYRGKVEEQAEARRLRADGWTLLDIADKLGVSKSSVSLWVRDVEFESRPRRSSARKRGPHPAHLRKLAEIEEMNHIGIARLGVLSDQAFLAAGAALYAAEGTKRDGELRLANSDASVIRFYCAWLRRFFVIDESRLRGRLYLHDGLDLQASVEFWSKTTGIPATQFGKPYRAVPDVGIRHNKHEHGCLTVAYACSRTHRGVMGLVRALLSSEVGIPG